MDALGPHQIELRVHGLTVADHGRVPGRVFANKLRQLVSALEASDELANGRAVHEYVLAGMHMSQPTARLKEVSRAEFSDNQVRSAIPTFNEAVDAVTVNDGRALRLRPVIHHISEMTAGSTKKFGFAEVETSNSVIRIDDFLRRRAVTAKKAARGGWYEGAAFGSFDGRLNYVDNRGALPQIKLTLTAGGKEIDCVCPRDLIDELGQAIDHRVRIYGRSIYSSGSPLPIRVEVKQITRLNDGADLTKWRGTIKPMAADEWEGHFEL